MLRTHSHADLSELIVWGAVIAPGIILNKDGSLQTSFRFRGPDLASATEAGLVATMARINNAIRRLGSGWALHVEARRRASSDYPPVIETPAAASLIDRERHQLYAASGTKLVSDFYLTFCCLLPEDRTVSASRYLFQNQPSTKSRPFDEQIAGFQEAVQQITDLLSPILPMLEPLDDREMLTYLHSCVSFRPVSLMSIGVEN